MTEWKRGLTSWVEGGTIYISVVFSWQLEKAEKMRREYLRDGYNAIIGGPAAGGGNYPDAITRHNPDATFTSRGCVRRCPFCIVPRLEGDLRELTDWPIRPIVCDNNLLACSRKHFDDVINKLKPLKGVDFNQGLDARLLSIDHADRLRELDTTCVRLAWDDTETEKQFRKAWQILRDVGIPANHIRVYVLFGFKDTPEDALYRLSEVWKLKSFPNPMRYQPIDTRKKNSYVAPGWSDKLLKMYMRYWSRLRYTSPIPFLEFKQGDETVEELMDSLR